MQVGGGDKHEQSAGDAAQQNQATSGASLTVNNTTVTVQHASDILDESQLRALGHHIAEGLQEAQRRSGEMNERLLPELDRRNLLDAVADPSFQSAAQEAQRAAANSGDIDDYDRLTQLLAMRAESSNSRVVRAGVDQAITAVANAHPRALHALSVATAAASFSIELPSPSSGIDALDNLFGTLDTSDLPEGRAWCDHLDGLGLLRVSSAGIMTRKTYIEMFLEQHIGYASPGADVQAIPEILGRLSTGGAPTLPMMAHEFLESKVRLSFAGRGSFDKALAVFAAQNPLANIELARAVATENLRFGEVDDQCRERIIAEISERPHLQALLEWWDQVPWFEVTSAGQVLANANLLRLKPELPISPPAEI